MKNFILTIQFVVMALAVLAQPQAFKYQSIVRDAGGEIISNQPVSMRVSILADAPDGTVVYTEDHNTVTNEFGLLNLEVGKGTVVLGTFSTIGWGDADHFLQLSMDITGGTNYVLAGVTQLLSVPYALYAENSGDGSVWQPNGNNIYYSSGNVGIGTHQPGSLLDIHGGTRFTVRLDNDGRSKVGNLYSSDDTLALVSYGNIEISIDENNTSTNKAFRVVKNGSNELFRVQEDGGVGIGTYTPSSILDVGGNNIELSDHVFLGRMYSGTDLLLGHNMKARTDGVRGAWVANDSPLGYAGIRMYSGNIQFHTKSGSVQANEIAQNEVMRLTNTGKLGIGTTSPSDELHIYHATENGLLTLQSGDEDVNMCFRDNTSGDNSTAPFIGGIGKKLYFGVNGAKRMYIDQNGLVGIGTDNPDSKLQVLGKIKATEMSIVSIGDAIFSLERFTNSHGGFKFYETGETQAQWIFPFFRGWQSDNLIIRDEKHLKDVMTFEYGTGMVGIGISDPQSSLDVKGNITVRDASENIILELGSGLDYAEGFNVSDIKSINPGTVLSIDPENPGKLVICNTAYDTKVAGIVAGANGLGSGVRLGIDNFDCDVALAGRVYCNVESTDGEINPGDLLTTSNIPGFAMKVKNCDKANGAILGKAMEGLDKGKKGQILVLVTLQ